jgi:hypothetical protein
MAVLSLRWLLLACGSLAALQAVPPAAAADREALARIRARLDAHPQLRADFVQTRRSPDLERPSLSHGRMLVWGREGVVWEMVTPVTSTVALRPETTIVVDARGARTERKAQDDAVAARIGRVLRALLQGDTETLEKWFSVEARSEGARWTITLTPNRGPLATFIQAMQVAGGQYLEAVDIREAGGESTRIDFSNHRSAAPLSGSERGLLGMP